MVCIDTTFLIDIIKGRPLTEKMRSIIEGENTVSVTTPSIIEIIRGLYLKKNLMHASEQEKNKIEEILSSSIILNLDKESAILSGEIQAELENKGEIIGMEDVMIGAIAKHNNETLITRNKKHFEKIQGLKIETY